MGKRLKDTVLSMGKGRLPSKVFRVRDPSPQASVKDSGFVAPVAQAPERELGGAFITNRVDGRRGVGATVVCCMILVPERTDRCGASSVGWWVIGDREKIYPVM